MKTRIKQKHLVSLAVLLAAGLGSFVVAFGEPAAPNIKPVNIASIPLYSATQGDKPTLALALSVEFPTVGAQYRDDNYAASTEYIGYYNSEMCYTYQDNPTEAPGVGKTKADYKRFVISGLAAGRKCGDAFSGNFLNWASNSAIDMLRIALSGGDRYIDEPGLSILQRAVIPNGDPVCFWNSSSYFPAKSLAKGSGNYAGAVPQAMVTAAKGKTIWIANTLDRIYFGTGNSSAGSCTDASAYKLNAGVGIGPITNSSGPPPSGAQKCADENGACVTSGIQEVWYGANSSWKKAPISGPFTCANSTFGDPISGTAKACHLAAYAGNWSPTGSDKALNTDGFFYARVEVCGKDGSDNLHDNRDYNLCTQYPNGNYKPTGTIQKYNNQLRLAAFGYAMEQTRSWDGSKAGRYGGVLRAPMKYVGPRTYDISGNEDTAAGGNPRMEWDPATGMFHDNPEGDTTFGTSGVINYLNKFGRTGPTPGRYKEFDPVTELYYETLRYMQGLPPTPDAIANLNLGNATQKGYYDGFPIYTDWSNLDPYGDGRSNTASYSCLKSNIAVIGDVNTWDSIYGTGSNGKNRMPAVPKLADNIPDIAGWTSVVQAFEKRNAVSYVDGQGNAQTTKNPNAANPNPNTRGPQLYGLAYWAHTHDIRGTAWTNNKDKQRPGLRIKSFFFDVNENSSESDNNKRRNNNQFYTAAKYGGFLSQPGTDATQPYNSQGNPFYDQNGGVENNVWQDAPGRPLEPQTYFLQSNARGVLAAFERIFSQAASAQRSIAGAAAAGSSLTSTGTFVYQASFDTSSWWGDVQAFSLTVGGADSTEIQLSQAATWSADQRLANRLMAGSPARNIVIGKRGANPVPAAGNFVVGEIEAALQADLNRYNPVAAVDGLWQDRVAYLRGDKSREGSPFRVRYHALGDIVNSGLQHVGAPSPARSPGEGYAAFAAANASRVSALYAGANDGMLHAFNASNGDELFAYIPSWLGPNLAALTDPNFNHQGYADATPVIGDAKTGSGSTAADWKTVLVSGTGGGGRGVFALDVTNPSAFGPGKVMWEFTQANDPDMGHVLGKPRIVKMRTNAPAAATATYRWFAMVPAGVNNYVDDGTGIHSSTGAPTIFLLALDKAAGAAWTATGSAPNYYKISLPFDATLAQTNATGVVNLEAFMNSAGAVDYVYAGDLHGKLWALDFTKFGADGWTAGQLSRFSTGSGASLAAYPMYISKDAAGAIQPITAAPTILEGADPTTHFVGFGTGKYIEYSDATSIQKNTYYTLFDNGSGAATGGKSGEFGIAGRGRLRQVTLAADGTLKPTSDFVWGRATSDGDAKQRSGWYYDLPGTGERVVYDSTYVPLTTKVAFSSLIPDSASSPGVCSVSGGTGNNYYVDLLSGVGLRKVSTVGVSGQPLVLINEAATTTTLADSTGRRMRTRPLVLAQQGSGGLDPQQVTQETIPFGRLSWRQVNNYLELHKK